MSQKVFPIFSKYRDSKKSSNPDQDDCIVYLGEHVSKDAASSLSSKKPSTEKETDENETKTEQVQIKTELVNQDDTETEIFHYYSQEQDSLSIEDDSIFQNSIILEDKQDSNEDDEEDEDIKLIFDSRDLIEQICRKYDDMPAKVESAVIDDSPILVREKTEPKNVQKLENTSPILVNEDSDSDTDILLCTIGEEFEKKLDTPNKAIKKSPIIQTKQGLNVFNNFQTTKVETLKDCLFGDDNDSLSSEDEEVQKDVYKSSLSSRHSVKPPVMARTVAKQHSEISAKRTILIDNQTPSKKQKLSSDSEEIFAPIERPPTRENLETEGLNEIDAKKKELMKKVRQPFQTSFYKKPVHQDITNKKTVELLINNKFQKKGTSSSNSISLTQGLNLAMQENMIRINQAKAKNFEKPFTSDQSNQQEIRKQSVDQVRKIKLIEKPKESTCKEKENEGVRAIVKPTTSTNSESSSASKNDVVGKILNQMNHGIPINKEEEKKQDEFIFENFAARVVKWTYNWLIELDKYVTIHKCVTPPPAVEESELGPLIDNYLSYGDYYKTMFPLLLAETWEEVFRDWRESKNDIRTYQNSPIFFKSNDKCRKHRDLSIVTLQILIDMSLKSFPMEDELIGLNLTYANTDSTSTYSATIFAIVCLCKKLKVDDPATLSSIKDLIKKQDETKQQSTVVYTESSPAKANPKQQTQNFPKNLSVYEICVYTRNKNYVHKQGEKLEYQIIASLSSSFRRIKSLIAFQYSPLLKTILNGSQLDPAFWFNRDQNEMKFNFINEYNECQQKVILECSSIIKYEEPKLFFLQGPPGTGKSHTIVGIINAIFSRLNYYMNKAREKGNMPESMRKKISNFKLLICSPSNGGCDELTRRIKHLKERKNSGISEHEMKRECNVVRVGRIESIHRDCEELTLDYLYKKNMDQLIIEKKSEKSESLLSHYKSLQSTEKMLIARVKNFKISNKERELKEAEGALEELKKKIKKFEDQFAKNKSNEIAFGDRKKLEQKAKENVLKSADIIICTLNFSGNSLLDCLKAEKNNGQSLISVIIIDEAAQCLEVDTLIPLRFGCDKIIQVGDPEQLPATVLSKKGQDRGFGMSMFERIYQKFRFMDKSPIKMLYVQYRMHPDICEFPSQNFYKGRLITHKDAIQKRSIVDLKPYLIFNVVNSQEIGDETNGSVYNPVEADQIKDFCKYLMGKYNKFSLGIITPYQKQVSYLKDLLIKNNMQRIEVGTVDGYQGREKDIVIFSSVRAKNAKGTIGFLAHRQRLNVALTRAKYALYIFCHVDSLVVNQDWNNCIQDAKKRNLIFTLE